MCRICIYIYIYVYTYISIYIYIYIYICLYIHISGYTSRDIISFLQLDIFIDGDGDKGPAPGWWLSLPLLKI